ncbi:uncharacterized protein LOC114977252 [Acropora millepora]|uniref:uncharacterized protein LOC114977252 n=1 Tax=Acropora millepora TaxID=45264 RepID=UPI001CF2BCBC|nr:uncharacterized protein LOC114977252 [Acropora millepora]
MLRSLSILILLLTLASSVKRQELSIHDIVKELRDLTSKVNNAYYPDQDAFENSREFADNDFQPLDKTLKQSATDEINGFPDTLKEAADKPSEFHEDHFRALKKGKRTPSVSIFVIAVNILVIAFHILVIA